MADAVSMYTNIDTTTGLAAVKAFIEYNSNSIPRDFPVELFLQVLECVMVNNIFTFTDTHWLQLTSTAMGTPVACAYAMDSFGVYLCMRFKSKLKLNLDAQRTFAIYT
jgi:hypothetical protein